MHHGARRQYLNLGCTGQGALAREVPESHGWVLVCVSLGSSWNSAGSVAETVFVIAASAGSSVLRRVSGARGVSGAYNENP